MHACMHSHFHRRWPLPLMASKTAATTAIAATAIASAAAAAAAAITVDATIYAFSF